MARRSKTATFARGGKTGLGAYGREEPNIWDATGPSTVRQSGYKGADERLATLFPVPPERNRQPPRIAPNYLADGGEKRRAYSFGELLKETETA